MMVYDSCYYCMAGGKRQLWPKASTARSQRTVAGSSDWLTAAHTQAHLYIYSCRYRYRHTFSYICLHNCRLLSSLLSLLIMTARNCRVAPSAPSPCPASPRKCISVCVAEYLLCCVSVYLRIWPALLCCESENPQVLPLRCPSLGQS